MRDIFPFKTLVGAAFLQVETHHDLRHTIEGDVERIETVKTIVWRELEENELYRFADGHEDSGLYDDQDN